MLLPEFNQHGDLPEGLYAATLDELLLRFGTGSSQREDVAARLTQIYSLAKSSGFLERFIVFGSFVTDKAEPNDVDIILVMRDDFESEKCDASVAWLFDHQQAAANVSASIFWMRPSLLFFDTMEGFIAGWQRKRDGTRRGIVEIIE